MSRTQSELVTVQASRAIAALLAAAAIGHGVRARTSAATGLLGSAVVGRLSFVWLERPRLRRRPDSLAITLVG